MLLTHTLGIVLLQPIQLPTHLKKQVINEDTNPVPNSIILILKFGEFLKQYIISGMSTKRRDLFVDVILANLAILLVCI